MPEALRTIGRYTLFGATGGAGLGFFAASACLAGKGMSALADRVWSGSGNGADASSTPGFQTATMTMGVFLICLIGGMGGGLLMGTLRAVEDENASRRNAAPLFQ